MNATIKNNTATSVNTKSAVDSLSRASVITMGAVSTLIGLWAAACLVGAVATNGIGGLISGFVSALLG